MPYNRNHNHNGRNVRYWTFAIDLFSKTWRISVDRRIQRTRDVLHQALISLMIEKGYEVITVQDIIDRANVGRSTFYAHYVGKQDLLLSGLKNLSKNLLAHQRAALAQKRGLREKRF